MSQVYPLGGEQGDREVEEVVSSQDSAAEERDVVVELRQNQHDCSEYLR